MYTTKRRIYGKSPDGYDVLLYPEGAVISSERAAELGLTGHGRAAEAASKALSDYKVAGLKDLAAAEGIDVSAAKNKAETIALIEAARAEIAAAAAAAGPADDEGGSDDEGPTDDD